MLDQAVLPVLVQLEAGLRKVLPEPGDEAGHQPGAQGVQKGRRHHAGGRVDEFGHGPPPPVVVVQGGVDVLLEHASGRCRAQHTADAVEELRAHLLL